MCLPAALAGWPIFDLATVYFRQVGWGPEFLGNAASPWTLGIYAPDFVRPLYPAGYLLAALASGWLAYMLGKCRIGLMQGAILSALLIPYLLPKMHERYFFAADVLAYCLAFASRSRRNLAIALLVNAASLLAIVGNARETWGFTLTGAVLAAGAIALLITGKGLVADDEADRQHGLARAS
jgi:hypothetical protein